MHVNYYQRTVLQIPYCLLDRLNAFIIRISNGTSYGALYCTYNGHVLYIREVKLRCGGGMHLDYNPHELKSHLSSPFFFPLISFLFHSFCLFFFSIHTIRHFLILLFFVDFSGYYMVIQLWTETFIRVPFSTFIVMIIARD